MSSPHGYVDIEECSDESVNEPAAFSRGFRFSLRLAVSGLAIEKLGSATRRFSRHIFAASDEVSKPIERERLVDTSNLDTPSPGAGIIRSERWATGNLTVV